MTDETALVVAHPEGEAKSEVLTTLACPLETSTSVDTFAGKVHIRWSPEAEVSSLGLMPFFIEYLKTSRLFDAWVNECPMTYRSPNAPEKRDVLGTI